MPYVCITHCKIRTNAYLVWKDHDAVIIDPPQDTEEADKKIAEYNLHVHAVLCTHLHFDHVIGCHAWQKRGIPVYASRVELPYKESMMGRSWKIGCVIDPYEPQPIDEGVLSWNALSLQAILTPGHSPGSLCFYAPDEGVIFSGDSIFRDVDPNINFIDSIPNVLLPALIKKVFILPPDTLVCPGHGKNTTLLREELRHGLCPSEMRQSTPSE